MSLLSDTDTEALAISGGMTVIFCATGLTLSRKRALGCGISSVFAFRLDVDNATSSNMLLIKDTQLKSIVFFYNKTKYKSRKEGEFYQRLQNRVVCRFCFVYLIIEKSCEALRGQVQKI